LSRFPVVMLLCSDSSFSRLLRMFRIVVSEIMVWVMRILASLLL
jgi:hypothetical protein